LLTPGFNYDVFFSICLYDTGVSLGLYDIELSSGLYDKHVSLMGTSACF